MLAALVAASNARRLANWAQRTGIESDDTAIAPVSDDDWAFEELNPADTSRTDPPAPVIPIRI